MTRRMVTLSSTTRILIDIKPRSPGCISVAYAIGTFPVKKEPGRFDPTGRGR